MRQTWILNWKEQFYQQFLSAGGIMEQVTEFYSKQGGTKIIQTIFYHAPAENVSMSRREKIVPLRLLSRPTSRTSNTLIWLFVTN